MAGTNDYLPFATGGGANVESQAQYVAEPAVPIGVSAGLAKSALANKIWRQASMGISAIGQLIANTLNINAVDDGVLATLTTNLTNAIKTAAANYAIDTGAADAYVVALTPALAAHMTGVPIEVKISNTNTTTTPTLNDGAGVGTIVRRGGGPMAIGDLQSGAVHQFFWDGVSKFICSSLSAVAPGTLFTQSSGNFTVPVGVTAVDVELGGGGGGGGHATAGNPGSGAGAGAKVIKWKMPVTPGAILPYVIGGGGSLNGGTGGTSTFNGLVAGGGTGGGSDGSGNAGSGGAGSGGDINATGQGGQAGNAPDVRGGTGGSMPFGGGLGGNTSAGLGGFVSYGGGGWGSGSSAPGNGVAGAPGFIRITWGS